MGLLKFHPCLSKAWSFSSENTHPPEAICWAGRYCILPIDPRLSADLLLQYDLTLECLKSMSPGQVHFHCLQSQQKWANPLTMTTRQYLEWP